MPINRGSLNGRREFVIIPKLSFLSLTSLCLRLAQVKQLLLFASILMAEPDFISLSVLPEIAKFARDRPLSHARSAPPEHRWPEE
jgi:hypothetical protein